MSALTLPEGGSIVVVDDDPADARAWTYPLEDAGFRADTISSFDPNLDADAFLAMLSGKYDALVCDHVLNSRGAVAFSGAELVNKANRLSNRPLPAVLISSHIQTDQLGTIHRWREGIPAVVDKSDLSDTVLDALEFTVDELSGKISRARRAFPTPIEVLDVHPNVEVPTAKVIVVGWRIASSVLMPLQPILEVTGLRAQDLPGRWLEADVNCYAEKAADLFFRNIVIAPDLPKGWIDGE